MVTSRAEPDGAHPAAEQAAGMCATLGALSHHAAACYPSPHRGTTALHAYLSAALLKAGNSDHARNALALALGGGALSTPKNEQKY
ncbi:hypothetical protein T484DRAFT_1797731 [Baffinella frigidus]|nr:hypothetical protein T484DRAFT_1797731 [Cryptophyta sp. CCMP2293]